MRVIDLKSPTKECRLRGYSKLRKAELTTFLQNNLLPIPAPRPILSLRPTRHPPPPPSLLVRFRPDRPRQSELLRQLEEKNLQLTSLQICEQNLILHILIKFHDDDVRHPLKNYGHFVS